MAITVQQFFKAYPSNEACLQHLFDVRYGSGYVCPKCTKAGKWYRIKSRPVYSCQWCGFHVHPTAGTIFHDSRTSLQLWFYAIYLFTTTRSGVSAKELQRQLGVTYKCAWRMGHQIRLHMGTVDGDPPLGGDVEVDETYIGGVRPGIRGLGAAGKTIVFGMLDRDGDIITEVVPNAKAVTLQPLIEAHVEKGSTIHSDESRAYRSIKDKGYAHKFVKHGRKQYVKDDVHVNSLEGYWARLKNSIKGTHVHVSPKHLQKYAGEFEYRFNSRHHPEMMLPELLGSFPEPQKKE